MITEITNIKGKLEAIGVVTFSSESFTNIEYTSQQIKRFDRITDNSLICALNRYSPITETSSKHYKIVNKSQISLQCHSL